MLKRNGSLVSDLGRGGLRFSASVGILRIFRLTAHPLCSFSDRSTDKSLGCAEGTDSFPHPSGFRLSPE